MKIIILIACLGLSLMAANDIKVLNSKIVEIADKDVRVGVICVDGVKFVFSSRAYESASTTQIMKDGEGLGLKSVPCK